MPLTPIQSLWLDTLIASRQHIEAGGVHTLWNRTKLLTDDSAVRMFTVIDPETSRFGVPAELITLPPIEQREAMLYILARLAKFYGVTKGETLIDFCTILGCLPDNSATISERWRKLHIIRFIEHLSYSALEDRPVCKICAGRVATGAGWKPLESGYDPATYGAYRADVHHECKQYALRVLMPRLRAQQAQAAAKASAEVDK